MKTTRSIIITVYYWGEEWKVPFKRPPEGGVDVGDSVRGKDMAVHLRSFLFTSEARKEELNHNNSEEKTILIPLTVDSLKKITKLGGGVFVGGDGLQ